MNTFIQNCFRTLFITLPFLAHTEASKCQLLVSNLETNKKVEVEITMTKHQNEYTLYLLKKNEPDQDGAHQIFSKLLDRSFRDYCIFLLIKSLYFFILVRTLTNRILTRIVTRFYRFYSIMKTIRAIMSRTLNLIRISRIPRIRIFILTSKRIWLNIW